MEDMFVLFRNRVSLEQVREAIVEQGYENIVAGDNVLNVQYAAPQYWEWSSMRRDLGEWDSFEDEAVSRALSLGVESIFSVSYHVDSLYLLLPLLGHILEAHDGWISRDDDFGVLYDRDHVLEFKF